MSPQIIFPIHLVLGYVAWLLCFGVYILPRLRSISRFEAHRAIATLHSFRFFGLVFILPGVVGHLPASFATFAAYGDFATGVLALLALLTVRVRPLFWSVRRRLQSRRRGRYPSRLFPRHPRRPSRNRRADGRRLRYPHPLRPHADDHALRRSLLVASPSAHGQSSRPRQRNRSLVPFQKEERRGCFILTATATLPFFEPEKSPCRGDIIVSPMTAFGR